MSIFWWSIFYRGHLFRNEIFTNILMFNMCIPPPPKRQRIHFAQLIIECTFPRGSRKKSSFLNGSAIKALPPPPIELNGSQIFF